MSMTLTEQDRLDAVDMIARLIPQYKTELAVIDALDQHVPQFGESLNLGYYRTFMECSCGTGFWYGDHRGDPSFGDRWALHRATVVREAITTCESSRPSDE